MTKPRPSSPRWVSPLRYPGGKARMHAALADIWDHQYGPMDIEIWLEPFAGGAGAGLTLLEAGVIEELWLDEKNPALAAFWRTVIDDAPGLAQAVRTTTPSMHTWEQAREVLRASETGEPIPDHQLALSALIVNRCSRSGMVSSRVGPIGGRAQTGRWHVGSRWNSEGLAERIEAIATAPGAIRLHEGDGIAHIAELDGKIGIEDELFLFVDPPYFREGNGLYATGMTTTDHTTLAEALHACPSHWLLTYDDDHRVLDLYPEHRVLAYEIPHTANQRRVDEEYAVLSDNLAVSEAPRLLQLGNRRWVQHGPRMHDPTDLFDTAGVLTG